MPWPDRLLFAVAAAVWLAGCAVLARGLWLEVRG